MNVCEVQNVRENMEYQCVAEDSKTRVYLSVVRRIDHEDIERWEAKKKQREKRKRKMLLKKGFLLIARVLQIGASLLAGFWVNSKVSIYMQLIRGTEGVGSELLIGGVISVLFYLWLEWVFNGKK